MKRCRSEREHLHSCRVVLSVCVCVCVCVRESAATNGVNWSSIHVWLILHGSGYCLHCFLPSVRLFLLCPYSSSLAFVPDLLLVWVCVCVSVCVCQHPMLLVLTSKWRAPLWVHTYLSTFLSTSSSPTIIPCFALESCPPQLISACIFFFFLLLYSHN